ncbi:MAG TPA: ATP-binding protein, partial [Gemmatimonadales bacterium]|nr:ATP-binding protein [Gemmatimonadales bacterium]
EGSSDYLVITGPKGRILFLSEAARGLSFTALEKLADSTRLADRTQLVGTVSLGDDRRVRYRVEPVTGAGPEISAVMIATPFDNRTFDPMLLVRAMLAVAPIIILGAVGLGYWLAGRALAPVQSIIDEVDAITDGRSLHRRLAVPVSADEISRMALTLNGMLARLERSFTSLHRFTADASHELKTPLMVLRAGVERALTHAQTPPEAIQSLDEALQQVNRMSEMVESLLTLARADEGRAPLAVEEVDLRDLVADAGETAGMLGEQGDVQVNVEVPAEPVRMAVDPHRIRELLFNLVTNAIKYTPSGGTVDLVLAEDDHTVSLMVRDTGIGIAAGDLPHIFDRFWRADPARSRTGDRPGTGLGLAITKWIAEAHGGSITVQSRPGRGTAFTVRLPRS